MDEVYEVTLIGEKQVEVQLLKGANVSVALLRYGQEAMDCVIHLTYGDRVLTGSARDFFDALCEVRKELEKDDVFLNCYGGSLNVFPSGMGRDMGLGLKPYRMTLGQHAQREDLVGLFETGADVQPATVQAQYEYFQAWLSTPRQGM